MKKIILTVALLAGMTFVACSSDDDNNNSIGSCVTCEAYSFGGVSIPEEEYCREDFENQAQYEQFVNAQEQVTNCN